jgi:hypothetical protein
VKVPQVLQGLVGSSFIPYTAEFMEEHKKKEDKEKGKEGKGKKKHAEGDKQEKTGH